ncbi:MAG: hypothetical protein M3346_01680 [Actinomycetota bacterium]|nr:hypothetical protein [Actinomycetota bacterium]
MAGIPFNATLFYFGSSELIGHLPVYGAMLALLVYGSDPATAPLVPKLSLDERTTRRESGAAVAARSASEPSAESG